MTTETTITVRYSTVDHFTETRRFRTLAKAREYAQHLIGKTPEMGRTYAISGDGIGKIEVRGTTLANLFGETV